jgi:hypothetical protein
VDADASSEGSTSAEAAAPGSVRFGCEQASVKHDQDHQHHQHHQQSLILDNILAYETGED